MMYLRDKAAVLLGKLYQMRRCEFCLMTVDDILDRATAAEIEFYFTKICER